MNDFTQRLLQSDIPMRIHLIGVAGSGMSGLASLLLGMGHKISGCDKVTSDETERLQSAGLVFSSPHNAQSVFDVDVVVYSSAISNENVALAAARAAKIPTIPRAECLASILATKEGIIISGTHGKTTTSAMSAHILRRGAIHPSHYVGAEIPVLGTNAHWDERGDLMVAEGDESDGTLSLYQPKHAVVLNIEEDHLDFYSGIDQIKTVFKTLLQKTSGSIIYCGECATTRELCLNKENTISYGWNNTDYIATNIREYGGIIEFDVSYKGKFLGSVELGIPGRHNVLNALASIALASVCGVSFNNASKALATFAGARRRFETKYLSSRLRVVDDYGHHPTEIAATLQTARSLNPTRIVVLFQPHRYTRTQKLADDFGRALQAADKVYVTDIYPASEVAIDGVNSQTIVDAMKKYGDTPAEVVGPIDLSHYQVGNALINGDMLITLGAGNVHEAASKISRDQIIVDDLSEESANEIVKIKLYEPMRKHTTILVGGPAQFWVEPKTHRCFANIVRYCRARSIPLRVVGRGSNILVRDGGIRGVVIHPSKGDFGNITVKGDTIIAGAGVRFKKLASVAEKAGITGFEWMEGIPGNVGGGLRMNAGAMGIETFDQVLDITFLDLDGEIRTRSRDEISAYYRNVPELRSSFALSARFKGEFASRKIITEKMQESMSKRQNSQPRAASAGCIFKNPGLMPAGLLVENLGLKDTRVGMARVSNEHGNFIVNDGTASAAEVLNLIDMIRSRANQERKIDLETEVQIIGEDTFLF